MLDEVKELSNPNLQNTETKLDGIEIRSIWWLVFGFTSCFANDFFNASIEVSRCVVQNDDNAWSWPGVAEL